MVPVLHLSPPQLFVQAPQSMADLLLEALPLLGHTLEKRLESTLPVVTLAWL